MALRFLIGFIFFFLCSEAIGQGYNGLWYGRAEANGVGTVNSYLCEIVLKKNSKGFSGNLSYFFGSSEYKTPITAKYWPTTKTIELNPFPLISFFAKDSTAPDCIMDGSLTLYIASSDSVLFGQLNPIEKYRYSCPTLAIYLRREAETEGMIEVKQGDKEKVKVDPPSVSETLLNHDSGSEIPVPVLSAPPVMPETVPNEMVEKLSVRSFTEGPLLEVDTDSILVYLYDNGKVDNDTISLFVNRRPIALNQGLSIKPIIIKVRLEPGINELAMYAINLGEIPPNTALCIVYAGDKRYDINLTSTMATNGTVRIQQKQVSKKQDP